MKSRIPVLVVGGFLGSGKTTLVRHLLASAQASGQKMAVISNEFGELGIDAALLGAGEARMVELAGGCVCCSLSDELVETLLELRSRVEPDQIVIECSGVALPFDTQLHLYRPEIREWLGDEACLVVVDAERWDESDPLFAEQLQSADLAVLNKCDLVGTETLAAANRRIAEIASDVPILQVIQGRVSPHLVFPTGPKARDRATAPHAHDHHEHEAWEAFELGFPTETDEARVAAAIAETGAIRAKGFVATAEGHRLVQGVGRRLELVECEPPPPELLGRVVVIRRKVW